MVPLPYLLGVGIFSMENFFNLKIVTKLKKLKFMFFATFHAKDTPTYLLLILKSSMIE
jgi:hypothetical protein